MAGALLNFLDLLVALSLSTDGMMISVRALLLRRTIMRWAIRRAGFRLLIRHSFQLGSSVIRDSTQLDSDSRKSSTFFFRRCPLGFLAAVENSETLGTKIMLLP